MAVGHDAAVPPVDDRYGRDVLASDPHRRPRVPEVVGERGMVVECADSGWCGEIREWTRTQEGWALALEDRHGRTRLFPAREAGFLLKGRMVTLTRPRGAGPTRPTRTASGSVAVPGARARVARASRIWVEGRHDAELVERVWGDDLRVEGVVVEGLDGIDHLLERLDGFGPGPGQRVGVLVDHLVPGAKESRIASAAEARYPRDVLVVGHPFVDIWGAIRPAAAGIKAWPPVPRDREWKAGVCEALGWGDDTGVAWRRLLGRVSGWTDLDPELLGPVERLIDFVTEDAQASGP